MRHGEDPQKDTSVVTGGAAAGETAPEPAGCATPLDVTRRDFLGGSAGALMAAGVVPSLGGVATPAVPPAAATQQVPPREVPRTLLRFTLNGAPYNLMVEDRWTLAEMLRDGLTGFSGTKLGCERGECGACTVLVDGAPVYSCSTLAVWMEGRSVRTVEGLAPRGEVSLLQQAFIDHNAPQCGFCTSGQLMSATALLERNPSPSADDVRRALVGNLCRCANYNAIVEAVLAAAGGSAATGGGA